METSVEILIESGRYLPFVPKTNMLWNNGFFILKMMSLRWMVHFVRVGLWKTTFLFTMW